MSARSLACAVLWASLLGLSGPLSGTAQAQTEGEETPPEAVEFYREAREHYEAGEYREAADDLERALMLDPDSPTLVYNLARVYELLGEPERALQRYEQYQTMLPQQQAREQDRASATIRRLQGAASQTETPQERIAPREVAPLRQLPGLVLVRENGVADGLFWGTLVGGVVSLGLGATLGGLALAQRNAVEDWVLGRDGDGQAQVDAQGTAQGLGYATDITLGLGGAAVIAAGLLYFLREHTVERAPVRAVDEDESSQATIEPTISGDARSATVGVVGRW